MNVNDIVNAHIAMGTLSILSGAAALVLRKGDRPHRAAGTIFVLAMIGMCLAALPVAIIRDQAVNIAAASFALYLVVTAWLTAVRRGGEVGALETLAFLCGASIAVCALAYGTTVGKAAAPFFCGFGGLAAFAAVLDLKVIMRGGITGAPRISRHLWRMCFAMFIATGSFFLGQQKVMPDWVRGSQLLFIPVILVLGCMVFWLVRVRFSSVEKRQDD